MTPSLEYLFAAVAASSLLIGFGIILLNPYRSINRVFAFVLATIASWFWCIFMGIWEARHYTPATHENHIFWFRLGSAIAGLLPWLIQAMIVAIAAPHISPYKIFRKTAPWLVIPVSLGLLVFTESFIPSESVPSNPARGYGYAIYFSVLLVQSLILYIHVTHLLKRLVGVQRIEMQLFVLTTGLACVTVLVCTFLGRHFHLPILSRSGPFILFGLYGLTVWLLSYHKIFDARQVISAMAQQGLFFTVFSVSVICMTVQLGQITEQPFTSLIAAFAGFLVAGTIERITRKSFGLDHDQRLVAPRESIVTLTRNVSTADELTVRIEQFLNEWCQSDHSTLLVANNQAFTGDKLSIPSNWPGFAALCKEGWLTPERIQRRKPSEGTKECLHVIETNQIGLLIAVPLGSDRPTLVVALGRKKSLRPYTYPEIRVLLDLSELIDNSLLHAILGAHASKLMRMESAMMVSRSLAHDLNNLTTPVAAYLLHTQGRAAAGSSEAEVHAAASQSVKVMNDYIRESLFFSRRLSPEIKDVRASEILSSLATVAHDRAEKQKIIVQYHDKLGCDFKVDPALFQRLALNLINNAIEASPQGSSIDVSLFATAPNFICLSVSDHGTGVPTENHTRIFDPYFTTKNTGDVARGLGLGLAICRKIAALHGGDISMANNATKGAVFTATFPQRTILAGNYQ